MLVVVPLVLHRQQTAEMATVDAQVTIGDAGSANRGEPNVTRCRWPDSEVPRTAERLRDVTAVAIAASTNVVDYAMHNRVLASADAILRDIAARGLIPPEWLTNQSGVLQLPHATVHLRYSPRDLTVEVISVPNERNDGPAILIRIPDTENTSVGNRYFESLQLDGINYPAPFATIPQLIASAGTLSGGEQQMLALSSALTLSPRLLLLDEPSLGLAPQLVSEALHHIKNICIKSSTSIVIVEQKVREVLMIADNVYVLRNGQVSFSGLATDLTDQERLREVYL